MPLFDFLYGLHKISVDSLHIGWQLLGLELRPCVKNCLGGAGRGHFDLLWVLNPGELDQFLERIDVPPPHLQNGGHAVEVLGQGLEIHNAVCQANRKFVPEKLGCLHQSPLRWTTA